MACFFNTKNNQCFTQKNIKRYVTCTPIAHWEAFTDWRADPPWFSCKICSFPLHWAHLRSSSSPLPSNPSPLDTLCSVQSTHGSVHCTIPSESWRSGTLLGTLPIRWFLFQNAKTVHIIALSLIRCLMTAVTVQSSLDPGCRFSFTCRMWIRCKRLIWSFCTRLEIFLSCTHWEGPEVFLLTFLTPWCAFRKAVCAFSIQWGTFSF